MMCRLFVTLGYKLLRDRTLNANVLAVAVRWAQFCIRGALQRTHYARGWGAEQKQH